MTALVLVHGGGFDHRCWERLTPFLDSPAIAVDLPGRGSHPAPLRSVTFASCAAAIVADVDAAGFADVVLVGHSLAGCSMPATVERLGARVRHAVFVACTVPDDGTSALDMLPRDVQHLARDGFDAAAPGVLSPELAKGFFGNDLDDAQCAWMVERLVPEAPGLLTEPVDLAPLHRPFPRTWVRPLHDAIVDPDRQRHDAGNAGECEIIDLDAGHMCMISQPAELARILNRVAAAP